MSCWPLTLGFQDALGADSYIVDLLEKGYRLKFDNTPPPSFTRNNKSVLQNQDFCSQGASDLKLVQFNTPNLGAL